ncbi:MAG TPA: TRAP transporter TatT component family protein [Steroidobacteraceae bacterium]|nr:TRAP transporter TatT component family protein [Steroidobacteraceae bacterium]
MSFAATFNHCVTAFCILLLAGHFGAQAQTRLEDSAKDALYDCPMPPLDTAAATATKLSAAQWDKNKLGCAADLWFALAERKTSDPMLKMQALLATTSYIDHVNLLASLDLYGVHQPEWTARIHHAAEHGKVLEERLGALPVDDANVLAARALYRLTWPAKIADTKTQLAESGAALELFAKAVALDPKALHGNALWLLGRLYYDLPEFAGGDPAKGIKLLEEACHSTPQNVSLLRYSAYVFIQERDVPRGKQRLADMLKMKPDPANLQLFTDELKGASELAERIGDLSLARQITVKRDRLFTAHPELLRRLGSAANMHGGVDPITGKDD